MGVIGVTTMALMVGMTGKLGRMTVLVILVGLVEVRRNGELMTGGPTTNGDGIGKILWKEASVNLTRRQEMSARKASMVRIGSGSQLLHGSLENEKWATGTEQASATRSKTITDRNNIISVMGTRRGRTRKINRHKRGIGEGNQAT